MKDSKLRDYSKEYSIKIIQLTELLKNNKTPSVLTNQLLRCSTSIGANIYEANYAQSNADFISKFEIALKECYESEYWLEILTETNYLSKEMSDELLQYAGNIRRMLISSIKTLKKE